MRKGSAMEGFIREDGTIRPIEHYDDTELRGKIQTNTDNISNLDSRVTDLEEHGGVEDPTKADKVVGATAGNLASLDAEGNLTDSGKKAGDFAPASHVHELIKCEGTGTNAGDSAIVVAGANSIDVEIEKSGVLYTAEIDTTNFANLLRALQDPAAPASEGNALITNGQVYTAITPIALSGTKAEGGATFPLAAKTTDTAKLDGFMSVVAEGVLHPVMFTVNDAESHNEAIAIGYAKWVEGSVQDTADVYVYVGAGIEFKASCQTGGSSNTWATNWSVTDHSDSFAVGGQS